MAGAGNADALVYGPRDAPREDDRSLTPDMGETTDTIDAEASLIRKLERRVEFPDDLKAEAQRWEPMRRYVHTDAMLLDEEEAVGTNFILRNQHASCALLEPLDPKPLIKPRRWLPPAQAEREPMSYPPDLLQYAKTMELLIDYLQLKAGVPECVEGAIQDAETLPFAWVKLRLQEDFTLDPVGYGRNNDQLDLLKRYERLRRDFDAGIFTDASPFYAEMRLAEKTIRSFVLQDMQTRIDATEEPLLDATGQPTLDPLGAPMMTGAESLRSRLSALLANPDELLEASDLPEVAHYIGFTVQQIDIEDMRWDWNVRRPEDLRYCRWMAQRAWMTESDITEKWGVAQDTLRTAARVSADGYKVVLKDSADEDPEYGGKDPEERNRGSGGNASDDPIRRGELLAVWEYWDRVQGRVSRWVQGTGRFLDQYVPEAAPSQFYPFHLLMFNRVTGKLAGPSDTDLQQPLQNESNRMRTWQREAQKSAHPRWMITKGLLRPSERHRFEAALPYSITEVERADDVSKNVFPIVPPAYDPSLYDRLETKMEMQQMAGIPAAALGAGNAGMTATSDAITNQQMGNQTERRKKAIKRLLASIYRAMSEVAAQVLPSEHVELIVGPGAVWPAVNRQQILANFIVDADATLNSAEERAQEMKTWIDIATISQNLGAATGQPLPLDPIAVTKRLLELAGIRDNLANYISVPALLQLAGMGAGAGAPAQGTPGKPAPARPDAQGPAGVAGGAPPGKGFTEPPTPEGLPGPI